MHMERIQFMSIRLISLIAGAWGVNLDSLCSQWQVTALTISSGRLRYPPAGRYSSNECRRWTIAHEPRFQTHVRSLAFQSLFPCNRIAASVLKYESIQLSLKASNLMAILYTHEWAYTVSTISGTYLYNISISHVGNYHWRKVCSLCRAWGDTSPQIFENL